MSRTRHKDLESHLGRLYGYAVSLCGDPEDAKDLVQDCAARALASVSVPRDAAAYRAWLFKILRHLFIDRTRGLKVRAAYADAVDAGDAGGEYWLADERLINMITVRQELAKLPEPHRDIIGLIDVAGLSYAEAATALGVPVGTVMSRISRARAALMKAVMTGNVRMLHVERRH